MSNNQKSVDNREKLMMAAIDLIAERGYNGVSTKEIAAEANVNEVTLFRQFGSKLNLFESAFHRYHYGEEMTKLFQEKLVWELETDLLLISRKYHAIMSRNRKMIQITLKENAVLSEFKVKANSHPLQLKSLLTHYFTEMTDRGKIVCSNPELQALSFMWMNYGAFISQLNSKGSSFPGVLMDDYINESVHLFTRALTP
nr:TetR/AcrR family transcriptional regulator [Evansella halocellulosilytica]